MMMELLEELMLPKIGLTNRFDPNQLDSLLHTELKKKSINIEITIGCLKFLGIAQLLNQPIMPARPASSNSQ